MVMACQTVCSFVNIAFVTHALFKTDDGGQVDQDLFFTTNSTIFGVSSLMAPCGKRLKPMCIAICC
jgi:hypothetical protein